MNILLINPNRYRHPPVIPVGIEYLLGTLASSAHRGSALDLCFSDDPEHDLRSALDSLQPDIAGISIRQVDTALYPDNHFFLPEIGRYVEVCHEKGLRVVLGGSGFSIMPREILRYTGADYGISGPGEFALIKLLDQLSGDPAAVDALHESRERRLGEKRELVFDYGRYFADDGIAGFRTQVGCTQTCFFCVESARPAVFRNPESVVEELKAIKDKGYHRFHLCDSEFNQHLPHCLEVCKAIRGGPGAIDWTLYLKPEPFSREFFELLAGSGATAITVSIDTSPHKPHDFTRYAALFRYAADRSIKVMIDLSVGYPGEKRETTQRMLDFLDNQPIVSAGVNAFYRIYPGTPLYRMIDADPSLHSGLIDFSPGSDFVAPVFYHRFEIDELREMIGGREKLRLEGFDTATNYQRVSPAANPKSPGQGAFRLPKGAEDRCGSRVSAGDEDNAGKAALRAIQSAPSRR